MGRMGSLERILENALHDWAHAAYQIPDDPIVKRNIEVLLTIRSLGMEFPLDSSERSR